MRINKPHVNYEFFDNEVVIVNLMNGNYYSLQNAAISIWKLIDLQIDKPEISELFKNKFPEINSVQKEVSVFIERLLDEDLISIDGEPSLTSENYIELLDKEFKQPLLEKYSDMQDLIILDPIHDIDEAGWPAPSLELKNKKNKEEADGQNPEI